MGKENALSRRTFLKAVIFGTASVYVPFLRTASAEPLSEPFSEPLSIPQNEPQIEEDPQHLKLVNYLASIKIDQDRLTPIVAKNDIFDGFKDFTEAQRVDDFNRYFPIYRAVDLKYQIPWLLLWIMHAAETAVSRDTSLNQAGNTGAMQIDSDGKHLEEAPINWEFLASLPNQRHSDDWKELLKGGLFIRNHADILKKAALNISDEGTVLDVVRYDYSAVQFGKARVNQYLRMKTLFD